MQGEVHYTVRPFWLVVHPLGAPKAEFVVVDTSLVHKGGKAQKVHGPATKDECIEFARGTAMVYLTLKGAFLDNGPDLAMYA